MSSADTQRAPTAGAEGALTLSRTWRGPRPGVRPNVRPGQESQEAAPVAFGAGPEQGAWPQRDGAGPQVEKQWIGRHGAAGAWPEGTRPIPRAVRAEGRARGGREAGMGRGRGRTGPSADRRPGATLEDCPAARSTPPDRGARESGCLAVEAPQGSASLRARVRPYLSKDLTGNAPGWAESAFREFTGLPLGGRGREGPRKACSPVSLARFRWVAHTAPYRPEGATPAPGLCLWLSPT